MATNTDGTGGDAGHGGGVPDVFPPFDTDTFASQILWLVLTFGVLYYVMAKVALPRIGSILETRSDRIEQDIAEAERLKEETDQAIAAYEQALADARSKAHGIAVAAQDQAKQESDAAIASMEAKLAAQLEDADNRIAEIRTAAMAEVDTIAADTTEAVVKALIGGRVAKGDITKALASVSE